jgi:hypothetical protein
VTAGRYLFIVAHDRTDLFEYFTKIFVHELNVRVVKDRRVGERRRRPAPTTHERPTHERPTQERRSRDRRRKAAMPELSRFGFAVVRLA